MSVLRRPVTVLSLTVLLVCGLAAMALSISVRAAGDEVEEIVLVARDMAFYRLGQPEPNPTLRLPADRSVRLTLVNGDRGVIHDLAAETLGVTLGRVLHEGDSVSAVLRTPSVPGAHDYVCTLHPVMMRGSIEIVEPNTAAVVPGNASARSR